MQQLLNNMTVLAHQLTMKQMVKPLTEEEALFKNNALNTLTEYCRTLQAIFVRDREKIENDRANTS